MSRFRYFFAIILGAVLAVAAIIALLPGEFGGFFYVLLGYWVISLVTELVWLGLSIRVAFLPLFRASIVIFGEAMPWVRDVFSNIFDPYQEGPMRVFAFFLLPFPFAAWAVLAVVGIALMLLSFIGTLVFPMLLLPFSAVVTYRDVY